MTLATEKDQIPTHIDINETYILGDEFSARYHLLQNIGHVNDTFSERLSIMGPGDEGIAGKMLYLDISRGTPDSEAVANLVKTLPAATLNTIVDGAESDQFSDRAKELLKETGYLVRPTE